MKQEFKTAQMRVNPRCIIAEGSGGTIFWATPSRARVLIDAGAAVLMNAPSVGPSETKPAGASEIKEPVEKKSSAADQDGHSTDSALSNEHGTAAKQSASVGGQVSRKRSVLSLPKRTRVPKSV